MDHHVAIISQVTDTTIAAYFIYRAFNARQQQPSFKEDAPSAVLSVSSRLRSSRPLLKSPIQLISCRPVSALLSWYPSSTPSPTPHQLQPKIHFIHGSRGTQARTFKHHDQALEKKVPRIQVSFAKPID
jgi:hypothetical protein